MHGLHARRPQRLANLRAPGSAGGGLAGDGGGVHALRGSQRGQQALAGRPGRGGGGWPAGFLAGLFPLFPALLSLLRAGYAFAGQQGLFKAGGAAQRIARLQQINQGGGRQRGAGFYGRAQVGQQFGQRLAIGGRAQAFVQTNKTDSDKISRRRATTSDTTGLLKDMPGVDV